MDQKNKTIVFLENLMRASVELAIEFYNAVYISYRVGTRKNSCKF